MAISTVIGSHEAFYLRLLSSFGILIVASGLSLNIAAFTLTLESGYNNLQSLKPPLQDLLLGQRYDRQLVKNIIKEVENTKPLSGNGYFAITKGTLTGMLSVGITYIIILVQFKITAS